jgi:hypothetical protein
MSHFLTKQIITNKDTFRLVLIKLTFILYERAMIRP